MARAPPSTLVHLMELVHSIWLLISVGQLDKQWRPVNLVVYGWLHSQLLHPSGGSIWSMGTFTSTATANTSGTFSGTVVLNLSYLPCTSRPTGSVHVGLAACMSVMIYWHHTTYQLLQLRYVVLPPFMNRSIRCFIFLKQIYLNIF
jgi:hypothetical protein